MKFTYEDIIEELHEEFPQLNKSQIDRLLSHALKVLRRFLVIDIILRIPIIGNSTAVFFNPETREHRFKMTKLREKRKKELIKETEGRLIRYYQKYNEESDTQ